MNKKLQINLFLARAMGFKPECYEDHVAYDDGSFPKDSREIAVFDPHTDKAQWAEVVLWAASKAYVVTTRAYTARVYDRFNNSEFVDHDNTVESRMAATLEAIDAAVRQSEGK